MPGGASTSRLHKCHYASASCGEKEDGVSGSPWRVLLLPAGDTQSGGEERLPSVRPCGLQVTPVLSFSQMFCAARTAAVGTPATAEPAPAQTCDSSGSSSPSAASELLSCAAH